MQLAHSIALGVVLIAAGYLVSCKESRKGQGAPQAASYEDLATQLCTTLKDQAKNYPPDQALLLLVSALQAKPNDEAARSAIEALLARTSWNFPSATIQHPFQIDQIVFREPASLWVGLAGKTNTMIRWNLDSMRIEQVMFPLSQRKHRSLLIDPKQKSLLSERGTTILLCDAQTLKPVCEIGPLPDGIATFCGVTFSKDGLLAAYPISAPAAPTQIAWKLLDTATGETIRLSEPRDATSAFPLAAQLDRYRLRVLHRDGSLLDVPLSPLESTHERKAASHFDLLHAEFATNGKSALALTYRGPYSEPQLETLQFDAPDDDGSLAPWSLAERHPWNRYRNIWSGLMDGAAEMPYTIEGGRLSFRTIGRAAVQSPSSISAVAFSAGRIFLADEKGNLTIFEPITPPFPRDEKLKKDWHQSNFLTDLSYLSKALSGREYDAETGVFSRLSSEARLELLEKCNLENLRRALPSLDFAPVVEAMQSVDVRKVDDDVFAPLENRLKQALRNYRSAQLREMERTFSAADESQVLAAIKHAGVNGPYAANALRLAMESRKPAWIAACLANAQDMPPILRKLAISEIAWLEGRTADALADWKEPWPVLSEIREREDWLGWEQADFSPWFDAMEKNFKQVIESIEMNAQSTPEQRLEISARLQNPSTLQKVGRARFAAACLNAALIMAPQKDQKEITFQLAKLAREFGADAVRCLRAEAMALTAMGDFQKAHSHWIQILTDFPVASHFPSDYAEAAYTAFENQNPGQAMEILSTGMHRFPNDANFALRAGWVALLTGNSQSAYRFLREGWRIGYSPDKLENATALLAIAAWQNQAVDDAAAYYNELLRISSDWENPKTIDTLDWPEELKNSLRELAE